MAFAVSRSSLLQLEDNATSLLCSAAVASSPVIKEVVDMIMNAYSHCKPAIASIRTSDDLDVNSNTSICVVFVGSSMAFLLDELCQAVRGGRLASPIKEWIGEIIRNDFETLFVGDFDEPSSCRNGTKGDTELIKGDKLMTRVPTSSTDLALLDGSYTNSPRGEIRFYGSGLDSDVYVKILPLLASHVRNEREFLPVQLSPMFRLMSTLSDSRYGGKGLTEVDAMLECPLLLPSRASSGMEYEDLSRSQQWVVTASCYFATCWVRQLINSFIDAADETASCTSSAETSVGSCTLSSQGFNSEDVQKNIIARLRALVDLEEDLSFTSSKCYEFAPPGKFVLHRRKSFSPQVCLSLVAHILIELSRFRCPSSAQGTIE